MKTDPLAFPSNSFSILIYESPGEERTFTWPEGRYQFLTLISRGFDKPINNYLLFIIYYLLFSSYPFFNLFSLSFLFYFLFI